MSEKGVKLPKMSLFSKQRTNNFLLDHMIELLLVVMIIALSIAEPKFIGVGNILNVLRNCAMKGVIAYGMCLVIISGEIDLSVGSQVALSAVIVAWVSKNLSATFGFGRGWETQIISSVVIGGTSMLGGIGTVWGTLIGVLFTGIINNGMTLLNVNEYMQYVVNGGLMFFAVWFNTYVTRQKS